MDFDKPFDRTLRRARRDRAARTFATATYLHRRMADELIDRLDLVKRSFSNALELGCADDYVSQQLQTRGIPTLGADPAFGLAKANGAVQCDEDRLPFADASVDLVVSIGTLDTVNDLPGALALIRRVLRPDGLLLAAFAGAGSLPRLRSAMFAADSVRGGASPRIHPQIDVRAAGDLLTRAGFALQVADTDTVGVRFSSLFDLIGDLRAMAATNVLATRSRRPLTRAEVAAAVDDFGSYSNDEGRTEERFDFIYMTAWSPAPDQPRPAQPGTGSVSLASVLQPKSAPQ